MQTESEARPATAEDVEKAWGTRDLALHFGVPIQTVRKAAQRGSIPGCSRILGRYYFDKVEALKWQPAALTVTAEELAKGPGGRFKKGNAFGVGNRGGRPTRAMELKFLTTLVNTVAPEDWVAIIMKAVAQAKTGDYRARQWLSNYLIGTPIQRVQIEADVTARQGFGIGEQAAGILAILNNARRRVEEAKIVDAEMSDAPTGPA